MVKKEVSEDNQTMDITLSLDTEALSKAVLNIFAERIARCDADVLRRIKYDTKEITREVVYSHKDEIIEEVIKRATKEVARKSLVRMIEKEVE